MKSKALIAAILTTSALAAMPVTSYAKGNGDCRAAEGQQMSEVKSECSEGRGEHRGGHKKGDHKGGKRDMMRMGRMSEELELTDEQTADIKQIKDASKEEKDALHERMIESRQALRSLDSSSADYDADVKGIAAAIADIEQAKIVNQASVRKQIEFVLTDEQKAKMAEMKGKKGKRHGKQKNACLEK